MISPSRQWESWHEIVERAWRDAEAARRITERKCSTPLDPVQCAKEFAEEQDAFINDTANTLRITRSETEHAAISGRIEWREPILYGPYEVRYRGVVRAMTLHRWNFAHERFEEWRNRVRTLAAQAWTLTAAA